MSATLFRSRWLEFSPETDRHPTDKTDKSPSVGVVGDPLARSHEIHLGGVSTPAECYWCSSPLAPFLLDLVGRPALLCPSCHRWTVVGAAKGGS